MCENGATAEFSEELWGLVNISPNNNVKIKCSIDFKNGTNLIEYLRNLNSSELVEDDFGNLRYIGKDPNNYVSFNGELWRIIGVMKDIENPDGTKDDKVKLIRSENIGSFAWASFSASTSDWSKSSLMNFLNEGAYYNRSKENCPQGYQGTMVLCDFTSNGLTNEAKEMISTSVWNLGGTNAVKQNISEFYKAERGNQVHLASHQKKWIGNVGLMYPSDYGYATSGGDTTSRNGCLVNLTLSDWGNFSDCKDNNWLFRNNLRWTLMHNSITTYVYVYYLGLEGAISSNYPYENSYKVWPVVYLDSQLIIDEGNDGSNSNPFILK